MLRRNLGIDIGTKQISICSADEGLLLREPSVAAIEIGSDEVVAVGRRALALASKHPQRLRLCWPVWDPVVENVQVLSVMLKMLIDQAIGRTFLRPHMVISVPCDLTDAQADAVEDAVKKAGVARECSLLAAPLCAALGAGVDISVPVGQLLVHVGASRTEVAIIFVSEMVTQMTIPVGGVQFDSAIMEYVQQRHGLMIGKRAAEQIKMRIGTVYKAAEEKRIEVKGRRADNGEPGSVTLSSKEMLGAMVDPLTAILDAIISVIEQTSEDMRADVAKGGITLTGGGLLADMDKFLDEVMGLRVLRPANAETAAAEGAVIAFTKFDR